MAGARVTVVHVCELGLDEFDDRRLRECDQALTELIDRHRRAERDVACVLRSGTPWLKLDNVAVDVGAGLIVVGRHGAGRGSSVELGSVAERLIRTAHRPVLIVS